MILRPFLFSVRTSNACTYRVKLRAMRDFRLGAREVVFVRQWDRTFPNP